MDSYLSDFIANLKPFPTIYARLDGKEKNLESGMNHWRSLLFLGACFPLAAQAEESQFDDLLLSESHFAPSQTYQYSKMHCELAGVLGRGNIEAKDFELMVEIRAQASQFACVHSFDSQAVVIGLAGSITQYTADGLIVRRESLTTASFPFIAFNLVSNFTFGAGLAYEGGEYKTQDGSYSADTKRLIVSGTFHQPDWEATLYYADRYRDTLVAEVDIPRETRLQARYSFLPEATFALISKRVDYPGIADGSAKVIEKSTQLIATSRFMERYSAELFLQQIKGIDGDANGNGTRMGGMASILLNPDFKVSGSISTYSVDDKDYKYAVNTYEINLSLTR